MTVKKIGAGAAMAGALAFTALGFGPGVANAEVTTPSSPGMTWKLDKDWDDWDRWDDRRWRGWDGPRWDGPAYYGPCVWVPPAVAMWVPPAVC